MLCHQVVVQHLVGHVHGLVGVVDHMHATLEVVFLEVAESSSSTQDLRLDHTTVVEFLRHVESFLSFVHDLADGDSNLKLIQKGSGLVLVKLDASGRSGDEFGVDGLSRQSVSQVCEHFNIF